ncbi:MAG: hypothetical protein IH594_10800 [Bacteroidales bacterium]|nr:hypothetical protein [Bacteroidales bacterium]
MENSDYKSVVYIEAAVIAVLVIALILAVVSNSKNKKNLKSELITSELRLNEKQAADRDLEKLRSELAVLKQQSEANAKLLSESEIKIAESEKRINALSNTNRSLRGNTKELDELKAAKSELEKEYSQLKTDNERILARSENLQSSLDSLEKEKIGLAAELEKNMLYKVDNYMVTATRGKKTEKIVICASRTKRLNVAFEVPQSLTETISFRIVTPSGSTINPDDKGISWFFPVDARNLTASLSSATGEFEQSRKVVLNYAAKTKLVKGEYQIQIVSDGNNIGNCRIMLK